jgi:hypothetical protein
MKYMSVWSIAPENVEAVLKRFMEADPKPEGGAKLLGRWNEVGTAKGYALVEADDPLEVTKFFAQWADLVDQKVAPVVEDEDMRAVMKDLSP